jgi:hypothetical protein
MLAGPPDAPPGDTLMVALPGPVSARDAPVPRSDAERGLFRQLYEALVRLDCRGAARPALAETWTRDETGRVWTLTLRSGMRWWDGSPVSAAGLAAAWDADSGLASRRRAAGVSAVQPMGNRTLALTFDSPHDSLPAVLADPAFAPVRRDSETTWPVGTGPYRLASPAPAAGEPRLLMLPVEQAGNRPPLELRPLPRDPRDALDAGADLLVTDDAVAVAYAESRPDLTVVPLPWSRTYVLVLAAEGAAPPAGAARAALAPDAVRAEARIAEPPFWWEASCPAGQGSAEPPRAPTSAAIVRSGGGRRPVPRVAYPADDSTARELASRIVAVGALGPRSAALPLGPAEFAHSLAGGGESAFVVPVPRATLVPCAERPPWPAGATVIPLLDTRARAIVRHDVPALTVDWDGVPRLLAQPGPGAP